MAKRFLTLIALCGMLVVTSGCVDEDTVLGPNDPLVADDGGAGSTNLAQAQAADAGAPAMSQEAAPAAYPTDLPWPTETPLPLPTEPPTATPDPLADAGVPVRIEIPAIGVDAPVELVGLTPPPEQAMDVPKGWMNAGWYQLGARPGDVGNAVVAGHLDTTTGGPAVFWDLNRLVPGDEVVVTYERGERLRFIVQGQQLYSHDADGPVIDQVFGPSQTRDLNLITCDGAWDHGQATYTQRLVVFTELDPSQSSASAEMFDHGLN